jgi:uncharacterized protein (UPF0335 family)
MSKALDLLSRLEDDSIIYDDVLLEKLIKEINRIESELSRLERVEEDAKSIRNDTIEDCAKLLEKKGKDSLDNGHWPSSLHVIVPFSDAYELRKLKIEDGE